MADMNLSIALDAAQAIRSSEKLTNALKNVDSATKRLNSSVGASAKVLGHEVSDTLTKVREATSMVSTALSTATTQFNRKVTDVNIAMSNLGNASKKLKDEFDTYNNTVTDSAKSFDSAFKAGDKFHSILVKISSSAKVTRRDLEALDSAERKFSDAVTIARGTSTAVAPVRTRLNDPNLTAASALQKELLALDAQMIGADQAYSALTRRTGNLMNAHFRLEEAIQAVNLRLSQMKKSDDGYKELKSSLNGYHAELKAIDAVLTKNHALQEKTRKSMNDLANAYANTFNELSKVTNALQTSRSALSSYDAKVSELTNTETMLKQKLAVIRKQLESSTALSFGGKTNATKDSENAILAIGKAARSSLYAINAFRIAFNLAFAASGLRAGTRVVADFDQTLADMRSIMQGTEIDATTLNYQMDALKRTMEELGATSRYTTAEAGQGMIYMAQAGLSAGEVVAASSHIIDLAVASNTSLARSSDSVVQAMRTFNIEASNAWQVTDTLAMGAKASVTSIEQLAEALKYVGPIAHTMGVRIDTVVAALGTLSDSGLQASMAGTGLRRIISEIVNPTYKARKILDSVGLTMEKLDIQGLGLVQVLQNIKDANLSVGDSFAIWGDRGTPALQTIMTNFDEFQKKLKQIDLSTIQGTARDMRTTREDTITGQWKASVSAIQEFIIKFSEYMGLIDRAKNTLAWFAETLREYNTNISESTASLAKYGSALISFIAAYKLMRGGTESASASLTKFTAQVQNNARAFEVVKAQVAAGSASLIPLTKGVDRATYALSGMLSKSRAAAAGFRVLAGAMTLVANIGWSALIAAGIGVLTKLVTETDRSTLAMERLSEFSKFYWKDATTNWKSAEQAVRDYADSLVSLNNTSLSLESKTLEADIEALRENLAGFGSNLYGKWTLNYSDIGFRLFGTSTEDILKNAEEDSASLRKVISDFHNNPVTQAKMALFSLEEVQRVNDYVKALETLSAAMTKASIASAENEKRASNVQFYDEAKTKLEEYKRLQSEAVTQFSAFGNTLTGANAKGIASELDKIIEKTTELTTDMGSQELDEFWKTMQKNVKNFDQFFDFDAKTYTVKLKDSLEKALSSFAPGVQNELKNSMMKLLGVDSASVEAMLKNFNRLGEAYKELRKARLESASATLRLESEMQKNLTATGGIGEKAKEELLQMFSYKELDEFQIAFTDTFATIRTAEGELADTTTGIAKEISAALQVIYSALNNLRGTKFKNFLDTQAVLNAIPKADRKNVTGFASASGLSVSDYDPVAGKWKDVGNFNAKQINSAFDDWVAGKTKDKDLTSDINRRAKALRKLANEQEELRLKHRQYVAEVTLGSTAEVDLAKLRLEKQKEINSVMETAASLNLTAKDAEIAKTLKQIELTYALKEAEAKRAAQWEKPLASANAQVQIAQAYGASAWDAQKNLQKQLEAKAKSDRNAKAKGSVGWISANANLELEKAKSQLLKLDASTEYANTSFNLMKETGSVQQVREAEAALIDLEIQRLQLKQQSVAVGSEEYQMYQKQIELQQLAKDKALDQNMFAAVPATLAQMKDQYSEWAMMSNLVTQSFDMMSEAVVNFITTGKFNFSEFTKQVGTMLIELTTKVMMFKAITSIIPGLGFANGGMANILAFADGGIANVKKFASGGMLTRPTLFNSSAGLALAGEAGYEHLMPAARLSNGKWGVYAEGMGGNNNQFVINTNINVEGGSSGNSEDDNKLAATISEKVSQSIKDTVKAELVQQMRAGGLLNSSGNRRW